MKWTLPSAALTGVSSFMAAGDSGSTTCGSSVDGTSLSYPAVSPFVTAVGGTRLTLGKGNVRVSETAELGRPALHPPLARLTGKGRPR
jgi:subtilase family serine protease